VAQIIEALRKKLSTEAQEFHQKKISEQKRLEKTRRIIEATINGTPKSKGAKRQKKRDIESILQYLELEVIKLQNKKRENLQTGDALKILKIEYEVKAVISPEDRKIFESYFQFNKIELNSLNKAIRNYEVLLVRVKQYNTRLDKSSFRWPMLGFAAVAIIVVAVVIKNHTEKDTVTPAN